MKYIKLCEIAEIKSGGTPSRNKKEYWEDGSIPWIKIRDIQNKYVSNCSEYITEEGLNNSSAKLIKSGSILYTIFATLGETAILNIDATTNQAIAGITVTSTLFNRDYIYYYLKSKKCYVNNIGRGVAQNNINMSILKGFEVPCVSIEEQQNIVNVLSKTEKILNDKIEQINKLDNLVKSRFVELFGDPVKNTKGLPVKKLKDLCININSGNTPKGGSEVYVKNGITFFRSQNVWKDNIVFDDIAYIDEDTHFKMKRSSLKHGDILMTKTVRINTENSSLGRAAIYDGDDDKANVNGHVYFIRLKPGINNRFILTILISNEYRDYIRSVCVGGIDKRQLNKEHIENFPIICPPQNEINEYVEFVNQINKSKFD